MKNTIGCCAALAFIAMQHTQSFAISANLDTFILSFPLRNRTPDTAKINSVFDHSMTSAYTADQIVMAYTGETGTVRDDSVAPSVVNGVSLYSYKKADGSAFIVNGNYSGAGTPGTLNYDGHPGIDFKTRDQAANGQIDVLAAADGVAHWGAATFNTLYIDHGNGYATYYLHLSQRNVAEGANVTRGQVIGVSGDTGAAGSPHLHFEVRLNGIPVDPYGWSGAGADPYTRAVNLDLWNSSRIQSQTYFFTQGLNLISFPFTPKAANGSRKFSDIFSSLGDVLFPDIFYVTDDLQVRFDAASSLSAQAKQCYFLFLGGNPSGSVTVTGDFVKSGVSLRQGLNLIGVTAHVVPPVNSKIFATAFLIRNGQVQSTSIFQNGLDPGIGYFIFADSSTQLISDNAPASLTDPGDVAGRTLARGRGGNAVRLLSTASGNDFEAEIKVEQPGVTASLTLKFGIKPSATDGYDSAYDTIRDIPLPGSLTAYFNESFTLKNSFKGTDLPKEWPLVVASQSAGVGQPNLNPVRISWTIPSAGTIGSDLRFELVDGSGNTIDMLTTRESSFQVATANTEKRYTIRVKRESVPPQTYSLNTSVSQNGSGSITRDKAPGADGKYLTGTVVTLTAIPTSGSDYVFSSWIGVDSQNGNTAQVTMNSDKTVTANFISQPHPPPNTPSNLKAEFTGPQTIKFTWSDNSNNEDYFELESRSGDSGPFNHFDYPAANATSETFVNGGNSFQPGATYCYRIRAHISGGGYSDYSNVACATKASEPVSAPTGVAATDGLASDKVQIMWNPSPYVVGYEVWRNTRNDSASATKIATTTGELVYDDTSAVPGTVYFYWVRAVNSIGTKSDFSLSDSGYRAGPKINITLVPSPTSAGTVSGADSVNSGSSVTVTATPGSGYSFVKWTENGTVVSSSASYQFTASADRILVANFIPIPSSVPNFVWAKSFGKDSNGYGGGIAVDAAGNSYITGSFQGVGIFGTNTLTSNGGLDIYLAKYDPSGNLIWVRQIGGTGDDRGFGIALDAQGKIYITGDFRGTVNFGGNNNISSGGNPGLFIAKYDNDGNALWAKSTSGSGYSVSQAIAVDTAGNCYVTGYVGDAPVTFGNVTLTSRGINDIFVAKYDAAGNFLWVRQGGGSNADEGAGIAVDRSGNVYVTGSFGGALNDTAIFEGVTLSSAGEYDFFVAKYDTSGNLSWVKRGGGEKTDRGLGVVVDGSGNSFVTGYVVDGNPANAQLFVAKYDPAGNQVWLKQYGDSGDDFGNAIALDSSGNLYIAGQVNRGQVAPGSINFGGISLSTAGNADVVISKLDTGGNVVWASTAGGAADDAGNGIALDAGGNVYVLASVANPATVGTNILTTSSTRQNALIKLSNNSSQAPVITLQPADQTVVDGAVATFTVAAGGNPVPSYQWQRMVAGTATWVSLTNDAIYSGVNTATLAIKITMTMKGDRFQCIISNGIAPDAITQSATLVVNPPHQTPLITSDAPPSGALGQSYSFTFTATGNPTPTFSIASGSLPPGLNLSPSGALTGTPTQKGQFPFTVKADNGVNPTATQSQTVTIGDPGQVQIAAGSVSGARGGSVLVPVNTSGFKNILALQLSLHWDQTVVQFVDVEQFGLTGLSAGSFGSNQANNGTLTLSWDDPNARGITLVDGTTLFAVKFNLIGQPGSTSPVGFNSTPTRLRRRIT